MRFLLAALTATVLYCPVQGQAHDAPSGWPYPMECCSGTAAGGDCSPIASSRVKVTPQGYVIDGQFFVEHKGVRWSPDEQYHACFPHIYVKKTLGCFWAPQGGM